MIGGLRGEEVMGLKCETPMRIRETKASVFLPHYL